MTEPKYSWQLLQECRTANAAQAQEIDGLKAHVDRVREAIHKYQSTGLRAEWALVLSAIESEAAQSLASHDAATVGKLHIEQAQVEEEVIERCAERCDFSVECRCSDAIRDMPRKYDVR